MRAPMRVRAQQMSPALILCSVRVLCVSMAGVHACVPAMHRAEQGRGVVMDTVWIASVAMEKLIQAKHAMPVRVINLLAHRMQPALAVQRTPRAHARLMCCGLQVVCGLVVVMVL